MVVDTSAIIAILFNEPDKRLYSEAIDSAPLCLISAVTRVELAFVAEGKKGEAGRRGLEEFLALSGTEVVAVTALHAEIAVGAFRRFGKGRHRAGLNIADCFQPRVKGPSQPAQPPPPNPTSPPGSPPTPNHARSRSISAACAASYRSTRPGRSACKPGTRRGSSCTAPPAPGKRCRPGTTP